MQEGAVGFQRFGDAAGGVAPQQDGGVAHRQIFGHGNAVARAFISAENDHHADDEHGRFTDQPQNAQPLAAEAGDHLAHDERPDNAALDGELVPEVVLLVNEHGAGDVALKV